MLLLSSGTVDAIPRGMVISQQQQQQGKTVYHISVVLNGTHGNELGVGRTTHTLVENCQPGGATSRAKAAENSPRLGKARHEHGRWPSLSRSARAGRQREEVVMEEDEEEGEEEEGGKMKTDRFLQQSSKNSAHCSNLDRDVAEADTVAPQRETQEGHSQGPALWSASPQTKRLVRGEHGTVSGHSSLPRAVLRRPRLDGAPFGRRTVSMYGDPVRQQEGSLTEQERPLRRPRSVCMLACPIQALSEAGPQQDSRREDSLDVTQQYRSRKAELRAVDGLKPAVPQRPSVPEGVIPRVHQRSWKPRPVSMTVLELRKRGSEDEIYGHTTSDGGGFLKGGFRWRLFGKAPLDKEKENDKGKQANGDPKPSRSDPPKRTISSLRRSLSLRIKRNRPRDRVAEGSEGESKECSRTKSMVEETPLPQRPFSYLTGRILPPPNEQGEEGGIQYIQYHSMGKVKVMEVPLYPAKLSSKPASEEPSLWQLIANRFRRKGQLSNSKCESQQPQSKDTGKYPLAENKKPQSVAIETLADTDFNKGQGKPCKIDAFILQHSTPCTDPQNHPGKCFFIDQVKHGNTLFRGKAKSKTHGECESGWHSKKSGPRV